MEHLLQMSKCSIFHNIIKLYMIFQRPQIVLLWSKGLAIVLNVIKAPQALHNTPPLLGAPKVIL